MRLTLSGVLASATACAQAPPETQPPYQSQRPSRDGTGKVYLGREISQVMGHRGAAWLERPERERTEGVKALLDALPLTRRTAVADIGAGTGYFTFRLSPRLPDGKVYAVDIQPEMLDYLRQRQQQRGIENVEVVRGTERSPNLPASSVDLVLIVDAYHEFAYPYEMMRALAPSLKADGQIALVEYRAEDPAVPIKPLHKMTREQAIREMEYAGYAFVRAIDTLPQQHLLLFRLRDEEDQEDF